VNQINRSKLWTSDFILIIIVSTGISFSNYFLMTTLPIYAQEISGSVAYSGFMTGVYALAALTVRPISGKIIDKYGRKKALLFGTFLYSLICLFYNFSAVIGLLIFTRILHGIGFGIQTTAGGAVAADVIPKARMTEGIGYFGLYTTITTAIAPGIAFFIIGDGQIEKFRMLFIISAGISLISMIFACFIKYECKGNLNHDDITTNEYRNAIIGDDVANTQTLPKTILGFEYAAFLPAAVIMLVYFGYSTIMSFLALYALEEKIGNIGSFFTVMAFGLLFSRTFMGKVADNYGPNKVVIPGIIILASCFGIIPLTHSLFVLLLVAGPLGLAMGSVVPAVNVLIINRCSPQRRGTATAAYFSAIDIGLGFGSIFSGIIATYFGYASVFLGALILILIALLIFVFGLAKMDKVY